MGTKQLGWPTAISAARWVALTLGIATAIVTFSARPALAVDPKKARDRIVELNKQALLSYEAKDFETARDLLTKALKEAKTAGLEDDKMTARTYLHLGAVYWVGFQDQAVAIQNFSLSKRIRPDIQLTPSIETADLKAVFDMATVEAEPTAAPTAPSRATGPSKAQPKAAPATGPRLVGGEGGGEPDLPGSFPAPLMCTVPPVVPPEKELTMRCALKPGLSAKVVQIHYRAPGVESYQVLGMRKTAKGWYIVTLPSSVMKAGSLQVYFDARDSADNEVASNGQIDSPSIIEVRKKGAGRIAGECPDDDPLCKLRRQAKADQYEAGLHRRRQGAIWFGAGVGMGWGFVPAGNLEWDSKVKVSAMTTTAGLGHLVAELGYMIVDFFSLSAQLRLEHIVQEQAMYRDPGTGEMTQLSASYLTGAPTQWAAAGFVRALFHLDLSSGGNFQLAFGPCQGLGYVRFPVKPVAVVSYDQNDKVVVDKARTIPLTDTRPVGIVLTGASAGLLWHLSRHFALSLEGRFLVGTPDFGAVVEGAFSLQLAFGGVKGTESTEEEEGEGEVMGPGPDEPGSGTTTEEELPPEDLGPEE